MRVLFHVHKFPPHHNAGAEYYALEVARYLADAGADVDIAVNGPAVPGWGGVNAFTIGSPRQLDRAYARADVVVTHLDETRRAIDRAAAHRLPIVHLVHNDRQLDYHRVADDEAALVVYNSHWLAAGHHHPAPAVVVHPPVWVDAYRVDTSHADTVTLINLTAAKGAPLFYDLARRLPDVPFLGVTGAYGRQLPPPRNLPNLEVRSQTPDIAAVYGRTRLLLVPSTYESWGRVAIEAGASGIPVLAHPTPGLVEALGDAGVWPGDTADEWVNAIHRLYPDGTDRASVSAAVTKRAVELEDVTITQLDRLVDLVTELA